jgi:peptide/nickel transport system permease protein
MVGVVMGGLAGYCGGSLDELLMRCSEFAQIMPRFFLALSAAAFSGPSLQSLILLIGLTSWPVTARLLRGEVLRIRVRDYVIASRALGARGGHICMRAMLPNALPPVIAQLSL